MVMDHSDSEEGNPLPSLGYSFPISSKGSFICATPLTILLFLWLYGIRHIVKDHSDSERGKSMLPHGYTS